jgi:hypothetical protein
MARRLLSKIFGIAAIRIEWTATILVDCFFLLVWAGVLVAGHWLIRALNPIGFRYYVLVAAEWVIAAYTLYALLLKLSEDAIKMWLRVQRRIRLALQKSREPLPALDRSDD